MLNSNDTYDIQAILTTAIQNSQKSLFLHEKIKFKN